MTLRGQRNFWRNFFPLENLSEKRWRGIHEVRRQTCETTATRRTYRLRRIPGVAFQSHANRPCMRIPVQVPVDGKMRQLKLGNWPSMLLSAAVIEWEMNRNARDAGGDPAVARGRARVRLSTPEFEPHSEGYTVRRLVADYPAGHVEHNASPATQSNTRYALGKPVKSILTMLPEKVTRKVALDLLDGLRNTPTYASRVPMELGAAWDYALDAGRIPETTSNWWRQIMRGRLRNKGRTRNGERVTEKRPQKKEFARPVFAGHRSNLC